MSDPVIYAAFDEDGRPRGFYPEPIYTRESAPPEAVVIPFLAYMEFLEFQGRRRWNGRAIEPCGPAELPPLSPPSAEDLALMAETKALHEGVAAAVAGWNALENSLAHLLGAIITQLGGALGMVVYYSPSATETRLTIVSEAVTMTCNAITEDQRFLDAWKRINEAIGRAKRTRNFITHGNICTVWIGSKQKARLTQPIFDLSINNPDMKRAMKNAELAMAGDFRSQFVGMSSNDVRNAANNFSEISALCSKFMNVLTYLQGPDGLETSLHRLSALEDRLRQRDDHSTGGRKRAAPQAPPQPSDPSPQSDV